MRPAIGITTATVDDPPVHGFARYAASHGYVHCVAAAGGLPVPLPYNDPALAEEYIARLDGLVLTGGLDVDPFFYGEEPKPEVGKVDPARDRFELALIQGAHAAGLPIFAICKGVQMLNVAFGGSLVQDVYTSVPDVLRHEQRNLRWDSHYHPVNVVHGSRLAEIVGAGRVRVNSDHHQAVDRVAEGLVVTARADDDVVEGLEDPSPPWCLGVQWHPERMPDDPLTQRLFAALLEAASRCRQVIVLTHVPPFPEAVRRENHADTAALLPGYCCGAVGELLRRVAADHPDTAFTVLSGHTHGEARATILPNLVVHTGAASYGLSLIHI